MVNCAVMLKILIFDASLKVNVLLNHYFKCTILLENTPLFKKISSFMLEFQFSDR